MERYSWEVSEIGYAPYSINNYLNPPKKKMIAHLINTQISVLEYYVEKKIIFFKRLDF